MNVNEWEKEYVDKDETISEAAHNLIENAIWRAYLFHRDSTEGEGAEQAKVYLDLFHLLNDNQYEINFK